MKTIRLKDLNLLDIGNTIQVAGTVFTGKGKSYLCMLPDEQLEELEVLEMSQEDWIKFLKQTDTLEVEMFKKHGKVAKAIVRKSQRQVDQQVAWSVYRRDEYKCRYCGRDDVPLTIDHLVLWEDGGPTIPENLVSACKKCNKDRGNTKYEDWLKSDIYQLKSVGLCKATLEANEELLDTLDDIELVDNIRSR